MGLLSSLDPSFILLAAVLCKLTLFFYSLPPGLVDPLASGPTFFRLILRAVTQKSCRLSFLSHLLQFLQFRTNTPCFPYTASLHRPLAPASYPSFENDLRKQDSVRTKLWLILNSLCKRLLYPQANLDQGTKEYIDLVCLICGAYFNTWDHSGLFIRPRGGS